jgi:HDOD domain
MIDNIPLEDLRKLKIIESKIFSSMTLGVEIAEFNILDDVNASKRKLQELGTKLAVNNTELSVTILEIARSIYFGHSVQGYVPDFYDAVIRMGGDRVKLLIFSLSLFALKKSPAAKQRAAKSASIGVLGRIIAEEMNLSDEMVRKVETGGLLSQLGKNIFMKAREVGMELSDDLIENYDTYLATRIIDKMHLDPFLKNVVGMSTLEFDEDSLSLVGIIKLAEALTEDSFRRYGKLVVKSAMPDKFDIVTKTPGDDIKKLFTALGVEEYLEIQEIPTERQIEAAKKHGEKK